MIGASEPWSILRALRAAPPGRATTDAARRVVFAAALEQAEQFLTAAANVGYATKPVQLFYALSQAGRAIAAVRADEPWEIRGHGASVRTSADIASTTVEPDATSRGALGLVAQATASELWEGPVKLGTLWASLPELPPDAALVGSVSLPLMIERDYSGMVPQSTATGMMSFEGSSWRVGLRVEERPSDPDEQRALVERVLAPYPRAVGWSIASQFVPTDIYDPAPSPILLQWSRGDENGQRALIAPEHLTDEHDGTLYFRPGVGQNRAVPSPLMTWWGLLLGLSSLARYEPVVWRQALDIDRSPIAWALERGLLVAQHCIPELVLRAVTN